MRIPEDIPWVKALLEEAEQTGRPIEKLYHDGTWGVIRSPNFDGGKGNYRVKPAPPQKKFRPMKFDELCQFASKPNSVRGKSIAGKFFVGPLVINGRSACVGDLTADLDTLVDCATGQPLQVEVEE